jgi:polygalacturonase
MNLIRFALVTLGVFLTIEPGSLQAQLTNPPSLSPKTDFDPRSFGAKGDGVTFDTEALQKAIDTCSGTGGRVVLSSGTFLTKPLELHGNMTLHIDKEAVLMGSPDIADYPVRLPKKPGFPSSLCRSLLYATNADGLTIEGAGAIDGNCLKMNIDEHARRCGNEKERPSLLRIFNSKDLTLKDITLRNPCMWTEIYFECDNLLLDHITVDAPPNCYNLDGIDVCDCHDVVIRNCDVKAEDDAVCLKSFTDRGLANILVENNRITCYRANAIKFGSATVGPISHVIFRNNTVDFAKYAGLNIASVDGSVMKDILVENLEISHAGEPLYIRLGDRQKNDGAVQPRKHPVGSIDGVVIKGMHVKETNLDNYPSCSISGIPGVPIKNVILKDCSFEMPGGMNKMPGTPPEKENAYPQSNMFGNTPGYAFFIRHADVVFDNVKVTCVAPDIRPWLFQVDANVQTNGCTAQ